MIERVGSIEMNRAKPCTAPWVLLALLGLYYAAAYGLDRLIFPLNGVSESPNGDYRVFNFQSLQDGLGHAPYGTNLSLTRNRNISSPDDGFVIFGGYCKNHASVEWKSDAEIVVYCEQTDAARTQVTRAYGIEIDYVNGALRSDQSTQGRRF